MDLKEIGEILGCEVESASITGFAIDSRKVKAGDLFFALKGEHFDGHSFLKEVAGQGGVGAVVEKSYLGATYGLKLLRVDNVMTALHHLAKTVQSKRRSKVIAVTGSVGKTTTKEFIAALLGKKFRVAKTPGNANSQAGLPLSILNGEGKEEVFVVEMGMNHAGEIAALVQIVPPDIGVVTKIGQAHIEFFEEGIEGIASAKAEIFSHPKTKWGVLHEQTLEFKAVAALKCDKITYGLDPSHADYILKKGLVVEERGVLTSPFELPFEASHFYENFLAAAAVARLLDMEWEEIFAQAKELKAANLRFEKIERSGILFINDCYNANPESVKAALNNLPKPKFGGKTVAVIGEMKELGKYTEKSHVEIAEEALKKVDHILCYGKGCLPMLSVFATKGRPAEFFGDLAKLKESLFELAKPGDVVLIKGSNSNKLWQLLEQI